MPREAEDSKIIDDKISKLEARISLLESNDFINHQHTLLDSKRVSFKNLDKVISREELIDPPNLSDGEGVSFQVTGVTGVNLGDLVLVSAPYDLQGVTVTAYVQAQDIVEIRLQNNSSLAVDFASGVWLLVIISKII